MLFSNNSVIVFIVLNNWHT